MKQNYDAVGNVNSDAGSDNSYLYDGEGRICAVSSSSALGSPIMTAYVYDAEGNRVAKGMLSSWPTNGLCPNLSPGGVFTPTNSYVLGPSGEELSQTDGDGNWVRSNVYAAGMLIATYDIAPTGDPALHFQLTDWLGSRRAQTDIAGNPEEYFASLPFGDGFAVTPATGAPATADDATKMHFTGQEHDAESGNDYFGARYYASTMGRWLSPDRLNLTDDRVLNPTNTLNKYVYGANNPLKYRDMDGKDITVFYESPNLLTLSPGHIMFVAENQQTGDAAAMSFGPVRDSEYMPFTMLGGPVNSTTTFGLPETTDELKAQYSSLTIQTSPEDAQEVINFIRQLSTSTNPYTLYGANATNCTTVCRNALQAIGILPKGSRNWTPTGLWSNLYSRYSPSYWQNPFATFAPSAGTDYGMQPSNYDPFDLLSLMMQGDNSSVTTTQTNTYIDCTNPDNQAGCQN